MTPSHLRWAIILLVPVCMATGCVWVGSYNQPRLPAAADFQEMIDRSMMSMNPAKQAPVSTDGVQVVFQTGHAGGFRALALSPNGRFIASSGSQDGTVKIWDVASGQEIRNFSGFGLGRTNRLAFSQDSAQLVTQNELGGYVNVFDVMSGRVIRAVGSSMAHRVLVSANGRFAVANDREAKSNRSQIIDANRSLSVIDLATGQVLRVMPVAGVQNPLSISNDGNTLITQNYAGLQSSGGVIGNFGSAIGSMIGLGGLFSPGPDIPTTFKHELLVWDVPEKKLRRTLPFYATQGGEGMVLGATLSPDGRYLVTEHAFEGAIRVLDLESGKPAKPISVLASRGMTNSLTFSPDGKFLAIATSDGMAKLFEFPSGRELKQFEAVSFNFSPDGRTWIIGPMVGGAPYLQEASTGKETRLAGGASETYDLALTVDGRSIVAGNGGSAKLWDLVTGQLVRTFDCPNGMAATSVAVSGASPVLATGCVNGSAWLWDLTTGRQLRNLSPSLPPDQFTRVFLRITRDGKTIVIGRGDQLIVSDLTSGKELRRVILPKEDFKGLEYLEDPGVAHEGLDPKMRAKVEEQQAVIDQKIRESMTDPQIRSFAIHPNGQLLAIGRFRSTTLWDLRTGKQVLEFRNKGRLQARAEQQQMREQEYQRALDEANSLKSLLPSAPFGFGRSSRSGPSSSQVGEIRDPSELSEDMDEKIHGANNLAFSPDGKFLITDGTKGKTLWDVVTGEKVRVPSTKAPQPQFDLMSPIDVMDIAGMGVAFSPDGRLAARGYGQNIRIWNVATGEDTHKLIGHTGYITSLVFSPDGRFIISGAGGDGAVRVWNLGTGKELVSLVALGQEDYVAVTPDQYYRASKTRIKGVAFRVKDHLYPFEQFDLRFNRPDIVLSRLGVASQDSIQSYRLAYERRLRKMGLREEMLAIDFHLPEIQILGHDVPVSVSRSTLAFRIKATDSKYVLDRINVFVNDVPIYGTSGLPLAARKLKSHEQEIQVPLVRGRNKIQVSVLNRQGTESLRETLYTTSTADAPPSDVYVVGIGVSDYKDKNYNLRYAAKDANDLLNAYKAIEQRPGVKGKIHLLDLTNKKATGPEIRKARDWLKQSKIHDLVVVFAAGHGMTDEKSNYYFGTYDIDPKHPATNGLPYEDFEHLLDGIPALQKILLLDTCFSGEIEKEQAVVIAQAETGGTRAGTVKMRSFKPGRGVTVVDDNGIIASSSTNTSRLSNEMLKFQQDWFADLRRGTGAAVISSSSGNEYSLEGEQWKNGVFTYALLNGLKNRAADKNKDSAITVSELQAYVIDQVRSLTQGGQNPTVRRENLEHDFVVY